MEQVRLYARHVVKLAKLIAPIAMEVASCPSSALNAMKDKCLIPAPWMMMKP
jgi:hypothetical protein